jgi:acetolactate synthase-1/2/3 large subunit
MKIKVSDYITNFLIKNNLDTVFTITGGFAMHLNNSFGESNPKFNILYQHHEQACGYSAIGYTKTTNKPSIVCTTAGCAATNTITPCLVAHQDSVPILFISGQVNTTDSIRYLNSDQSHKKLKLRHYAGADSDIISLVSEITNFSYEIKSVDEIPDIMNKAIFYLTHKRPGPVWLSIPANIQGMFIEDTPIIKPCNIAPPIANFIAHSLADLTKIHDLLLKSKRPVIIAGNGIKLGNCQDKFTNFIKKYKIPVVVTFHGSDLILTENELYSGKIGLIGDRVGNFVIQNSDLILSFGCRLAQGIVGYNPSWFAREAKIIYFDIDENEIQKDFLNNCLKLNMDLNYFFDNYHEDCKFEYTQWIEKCNYWKNKWWFETPDLTDQHGINPYYVLKTFFTIAPENKIITCSSGANVTNVWHMLNVKKGDQFIISSQGDMGFELPAGIGCCFANKLKTTYCILGEGSLQLNIQELQTIVHNKLPVKILIFNNSTYGAIHITQVNYFNNKYGIDKSSGVSFPDTEKIAFAYNIKYLSVRKNENVLESLNTFIECKEPIILEIFSCIQTRYPKISAVKNPDNTFTAQPMENLEPFMDKEEFLKEMIIKPL